MGSLASKLRMPSKEQALPGRAARMRVPEKHFVLGAPLEPPFPAGHRARALRNGLLLGRRAQVLGGARRLHDGGRLRRRRHAEPELRGSLLGAHGTQRSRARGLRSRAHELRRAAAHLLGEPRPDAGHAPGQRHRHPVPLGDLRPLGRAARAGARLARRVPAAPARGGLGRDHDRDRGRARVLLRRGVSPAIPGEESARLLRARRHGSHLSRRPRLRCRARARQRALFLCRVDVRSEPLPAARDRGRAGGIHFLLCAGQHRLSARLRQQVSLHARRRSPLPRRQALHRALLADSGDGRGDRAAALHDLRGEAADPAPGAGGEVGGVGRRAHRQPLRLRRRPLALARGLPALRTALAGARRAHGRDDRDHPRPHAGRLLRVPRPALRRRP